MKLRECDSWGCGHYGAKRGPGTHEGVDIVSIPGDPVFCLNRGIVTKVGYCYSDDLSYRYVEITDAGVRWRYFYCDPIVNVGDEVDAYTQIGTAQALGPRYPGITEHTHLEVIDKDGNHIDPTPLVSE